MENDAQMIAYLILEHKYLEMLGLYNAKLNDIVKNNVFPQNWHLEYSIDARMKYLGMAIKEKKILSEVIEYDDTKIL